MSYNGWSNRETWLVNVWYNPESKAELEYIQETILETIQELRKLPLGDMLADMLGDGEIDWEELAENLPETAEN